ncbi:indoleacetamide hydrolase [Actinomycetospora endophytica]|uniref:Indoleacetamide hydrolase n=1 Tax=Actinomycetospora endophytica TaxID=2291215 RepID=A0ABS8PC16_9PSEU|nr:indoleacetamide hydrolase [Actinomycetospora endophytica]MCD2195796.1 indoleacetamide hydrolase [Actinomycetospora endophytica]
MHQDLTATEVVGAVARGELTALAAVESVLERAEERSDLGAVVALDPHGARSWAAAIDAARDAGTPLGPLAGLPLLVKDNINTSALPTTGGTPALRDVRPTSDAPVLARLVAAGAVVVGKTTMHELALGVTTTNLAPHAAITRNPYDPTRIPGGSSGGTAAAIAARIGPAGLGTDTGASVRTPAALSGIVGFRPSTGGPRRRYSGAGVLPLSHTLDTVGPMARTVRDVALLDSVITGGSVPAPVPLAGLRIGTPAVLWSDLERPVATVMDEARRRLADAGVVLVDVDMPDALALTEKIVFPLALHEPRSAIPDYLRETGVEGVKLEDIAAGIASPDVRAAFAAVTADAFGDAYPDAIAVHRPRLQQVYADYLADNGLDAILFPTSPVLPAPIDAVNGSGTLSVDGGPAVDTFTTTIRTVSPGSCAGVPSLSVPAGRTPAGLPVGLGLEGPVDADTAVLAIGMAVEDLLGPLPAPPPR